MKVAIAQIQSSDNPYENLSQVDSFIKKAQNLGAHLICFPENIFYRGPSSHPAKSESIFTVNDQGEIVETSPFTKLFIEYRSRWKINVSLGSVLEKNLSANPFNSHWILKPQETSRKSYNKIHLFSLQSNNLNYNEHLDFSPGKTPTVIELNEWRYGLSICYDLRFPELYRHLVVKEKAEVLLVPAAFTRTTGEAHWHTLLRARAIENQSYIIASAQWGKHYDAKGTELFCYGHSLAYDPWGELLTEATAEGDALLIVDLLKTSISEVRQRIPAIDNTCFPFNP